MEEKKEEEEEEKIMIIKRVLKVSVKRVNFLLHVHKENTKR